MVNLDLTDKKILNLLQQNSKANIKEIALKIGLTQTPTYERIKRLEKDGVIKNYIAVLDKEKVEDKRYQLETYLSQVPTDSTAINGLIKERNEAYYHLGNIYKDKFKRYDLSILKYEKLLTLNPETKFVLPSLYSLYKMYLITDATKAQLVKNKILTEYSDSRYAQLLSNTSIELTENDPQVAYANLMKLYDAEKYADALSRLEDLLIRFEGEPIVSKMELLKAYCLAKLDGVDEYKKALQFVALNFPNVEEGKKADELLKTSVPELENFQFKPSDGGYWKIIYEFSVADSETEKIKKESESLKANLPRKNRERPERF
mgnify:CR=1 FL=1